MKRYLLLRWCLLGLMTLSTLTGFSQLSLRIAPAAAKYSVNQTVTVTVGGGTEGATYTISALASSTGTALSSVTILNGSSGNTLSWAAGQEEATFRVRFLAGSEGEGRLIQLINNANAGDIGQTGQLTIIAAPVITVSSPPVYSEQQSITATLTGGIPGKEYVVQLFDGYPFENNEDNELSHLISPLTGEGGINTIAWSATTTSGQFFVTFEQGTKGKNRTLVVGDLDLTHFALTQASEVITCPIAVSIAVTPSRLVMPGSSVTLTASGATSYTWSDGSTQNPLVLSSVNSATTLSVTGVSGGCSATAGVSVSLCSLTASIAPTSLSFCSNVGGLLTASGAGVGGTYRWSTNAASATTAAVTVNSSDLYSVTATSADGCWATATVNTTAVEPYALDEPQLSASSSAVCEGGSVSVTATVSGTLKSQGQVPVPTVTYQYQWYKDGASLGSAQSSSVLVLNGVSSAQVGSYVVVIRTSDCGSATSTAFTLTVNPLPTVTIVFPAIASVNPAGPVVTVPVGTGLSYQVLGGGSNARYERKIILDRTNGFEIRTVLDNQTGIFPIDRPGLYTINVTDGNGCSRAVTGQIVAQ